MRDWYRVLAGALLAVTPFGHAICDDAPVAGQIVCSVVVPLNCPQGQAISCSDTTDCWEFDVPVLGTMALCPAGTIETRNNAGQYDGITPAQVGQAGHLLFIHKAPVVCTERKECTTFCEWRGVFWGCMPGWFTQWEPVETFYDLDPETGCTGQQLPGNPVPVENIVGV